MNDARMTLQSNLNAMQVKCVLGNRDMGVSPLLFDTHWHEVTQAWEVLAVTNFTLEPYVPANAEIVEYLLQVRSCISESKCSCGKKAWCRSGPL
jgi:hypothetical protein